jgi:hypothetical protein
MKQGTWIPLYTGSVFGVCLVLAVVMASAQNENQQPREPLTAGPMLSAVKTDSVNADSLLAVMKQGFLPVEPIFDKGCYDCHSDKTRYPWYHALPVIKGMIDKDIRSARKHLDMSGGAPFSKIIGAADILVAIKNELQAGDMPPLGYRMMHWCAKPSAAEADSVYTWIDRSLATLADHGFHPVESGNDTGQ